MPKKKTIPELIEELRMFHHNEAADAFEKVHKAFVEASEKVTEMFIQEDVWERENDAWWEGYAAGADSVELYD